MKKRQKEIEQKYEEQWDGGKGSHHPDYDPEAVSLSRLGWACRIDRLDQARDSEPSYAARSAMVLPPWAAASNAQLPTPLPVCRALLSSALGVQHGDDVIKASRETEELYNAIVKVKIRLAV